MVIIIPTFPSFYSLLSLTSNRLAFIMIVLVCENQQQRIQFNRSEQSQKTLFKYNEIHVLSGARNRLMIVSEKLYLFRDGAVASNFLKVFLGVGELFGSFGLFQEGDAD
ncbi:hypothetical protein P4T79_04100 [Bacillus mojavensis]|uniref:hypothetical protein n=1 Tax=Bacillus mojavensis TaxID=72360 RepID=UPI002DBD533A|nr:hypothetical protein [Bacillus mojavensis]MEC1620310.1 hypothetical protein [Bacillus mojavensis]MEC1658013.1 hypothetical protein [Bacillus mojavensis]MEC1731739.1 hypothetical protein [Bacillus mojavensis]MED1005820.1 hypothetical protein [Bacillus mojavensis]